MPTGENQDLVRNRKLSSAKEEKRETYEDERGPRPRPEGIYSPGEAANLDSRYELSAVFLYSVFYLFFIIGLWPKFLFFR